MKTNYSQVVEMTDEEKYKMYMKLSKSKIVKMHIELEKYIQAPKEKVYPYTMDANNIINPA